jgi:hypothetical protein
MFLLVRLLFFIFILDSFSNGYVCGRNGCIVRQLQFPRSSFILPKQCSNGVSSHLKLPKCVATSILESSSPQDYDDEVAPIALPTIVVDNSVDANELTVGRKLNGNITSVKSNGIFVNVTASGSEDDQKKMFLPRSLFTRGAYERLRMASKESPGNVKIDVEITEINVTSSALVGKYISPIECIESEEVNRILLESNTNGSMRVFNGTVVNVQGHGAVVEIEELGLDGFVPIPVSSKSKSSSAKGFQELPNERFSCQLK